MGQKNARRMQTKFRAVCTTPTENVRQDVDNTCIFEVNDIVDIIDVDANGNVISVISENNKIISIIPNSAVLLDTLVDTSTATGTPMIRNQTLDDAQSAFDRLMCRDGRPAKMSIIQNVEAQELNAPLAGQTIFDIDDASLFRVGDQVDVLADEGDIQLGVTVAAVNVNADSANNKATIVVTGVIDTSSFTNPFVKLEMTTEDAILRNQERVDGIDQPVENRYLGDGEGTLTAFMTADLFVEGSSKLFGESRLKLGIAGTRASHTEGAGNAQLIVTSMILGLLGNEVEIEVVNAAGLAVTVTKTFKVNASGTSFAQSQYLVQVNSNSGAATSKQIADAINADVTAQRIMQVQYGGDGAGVVTPFAAVNLSGGLDDGSRDYAELEQIYENSIIGTGFKWVSAHIRPNENNRLDAPFEDDEELDVDYRKAIENVDR
tara:strand:+ start:109136 stop:110437 length:1302 start_codon:yes stop_codon:yes gene_type:complete